MLLVGNNDQIMGKEEICVDAYSITNLDLRHGLEGATDGLDGKFTYKKG